MAQKNTQALRVAPTKLKKATTALDALLQIAEYKPQRTEFGHKQATSVQSELAKASKTELAAKNAWDAARDAAAKAEWNAYNFMLEAAEQVVGQYGSNSDQYASLGYKKKTEYKKTGPGKKKIS